MTRGGNSPVHYLESSGQSATARNPFVRDRSSDGRAEDGPKGKVTGYLSLFRTRGPPRPFRGPYDNGQCAATKAKQPKYWRKSRYSAAVSISGKGSGTEGDTGPAKYLLPSCPNLIYSLVILLDGQTATFRSVVESRLHSLKSRRRASRFYNLEHFRFGCSSRSLFSPSLSRFLRTKREGASQSDE